MSMNRSLFVQQERFEDRVRLALEHVVAGDLQHALLFDEALRQYARNAARAGEELRLDVLDQDRGELRDGLGGPVIAAHQLFAGALGDGRLVAEAFGHRRLQVEHHDVLTTPGGHMKPGAQRLQETFVVAQFARLALGDQAARFEFAPAAAKPGRLGDPENQLKIAQAARTFLDVGFERVGCVLELGVALAHFEHFRLEEGLWIERRAVTLREVVE
jgi:hypothetical protein